MQGSSVMTWNNFLKACVLRRAFHRKLVHSEATVAQTPSFSKKNFSIAFSA